MKPKVSTMLCSLTNKLNCDLFLIKTRWFSCLNPYQTGTVSQYVPCYDEGPVRLSLVTLQQSNLVLGVIGHRPRQSFSYEDFVVNMLNNTIRLPNICKLPCRRWRTPLGITTTQSSLVFVLLLFIHF